MYTKVELCCLTSQIPFKLQENSRLFLHTYLNLKHIKLKNLLDIKSQWIRVEKMREWKFKKIENSTSPRKGKSQISTTWIIMMKKKSKQLWNIIAEKCWKTIWWKGFSLLVHVQTFFSFCSATPPDIFMFRTQCWTYVKANEHCEEIKTDER